MATVGACALLKATGLWVMHEGNIIVVGSEQLEVAAACNGLSMLVSLAATIVATVLLTPMAIGRRTALFLSIMPIGLACNVIRIATTAWCYDRYGVEDRRPLGARHRRLADDAAGHRDGAGRAGGSSPG